jgi:drug/metabolite transporter (DMT)-like permease
MKLSDRRLFWLLVTPCMLWWVAIPTHQVPSQTFLIKMLMFLNTVLLVGWLKYREHLFKGVERRGMERWAFYLLLAVGLVWIAASSLERQQLYAIEREAPIAGLLIRATAALVFIAYMWLWGHVRTEPDAVLATTGSHHERGKQQ